MKAYVELVRAPAALTALGDPVAGSAAAGLRMTGRRLLLPLSSAAFYWAGMALNDWADRKLDAVERPERPIPSGRVSAGSALATGTALTAAGLGLAALGGGRKTVQVAVPLAAAVWAYDTVFKPTPAGPVAMAVCRTLDVLLGAGDQPGKAAGAAAAVGVHTLGVTALSTGEVHGADATTARVALATSCAATTLALTGPARGGWRRLVSMTAASGYAGLVGRAQAAAVRDPSAPAVRTATVTGIHGMVPLQAAVAAKHTVLGAALVSAALPLARKLSRKVSPT
ncbi:SCO3242 family prenyltransferase [Amycolatopsis jiangsuensis]|uniref:4-hydroxybenzoate polyprenyltransferase n=1 Tax=Amycolatopsis jiangsuensis TaxID=1181879 RepID=A0A840J5S1_9PSEU|nr:UbiA family prenyltransferase [Amycolatopsis jiangsuensis]MBB4689059.1 4-hydroxybenzoate polyprenyltransferase [Amycolatopsis jiangsuensis]